MSDSVLDVPPQLNELAVRMPTPAVIRTRLDEARREAAFLRKLLRVAIDAEGAIGRRHTTTGSGDV